MAFINVAAANAAPTANGDNVITNVALGSSFAIPEWALLNNDTDPEGATLDVTTVSVGSGGTAAHTPGIGNGGHVSFTDPAPAGGSFTYSATDGTTASPSATVTVTQDAVGDLNGTASADILLGSGSVTFVGGDGHDVLIAITSGSNNIYQFDLNDGSDIINDASGTEDRVRIATASSTDPIGTLGFEQLPVQPGDRRRLDRDRRPQPLCRNGGRENPVHQRRHLVRISHLAPAITSYQRTIAGH